MTSRERKTKKPGFICKKIPDLDIHLASHIDPDTRDTQGPRSNGGAVLAHSGPTPLQGGVGPG